MLRPAVAADAGLLAQALACAADWRAPVPRPVDQVLADPAAAHYVAGLRPAGDHGVVAVDAEPLGATWWRYLPDGYGFVRADVPELTLGVLPRHRGRGTGTALLERLVADARAAGLPALSLSVEPDNPALRLYRRVGFADAGGADGALTLLLPLR